MERGLHMVILIAKSWLEVACGWEGRLGSRWDFAVYTVHGIALEDLLFGACRLFSDDSLSLSLWNESEVIADHRAKSIVKMYLCMCMYARTQKSNTSHTNTTPQAKKKSPRNLPSAHRRSSPCTYKREPSLRGEPQRTPKSPLVKIAASQDLLPPLGFW